MENKLKSTFKRLARLVMPMAVAIGIAFFCSRYFYQLMLIQGDSMAPTYHNLQLVVLDKRDRTFEAGDVIAFECRGLSAILVKRIVAVPGDSVVIDRGVLTVNGAASSVYGRDVTFEYAGLLENAIVLGDGEYVVIGDNIVESRDSRYDPVGIVRAGDIIGKLVGVKQPQPPL